VLHAAVGIVSLTHCFKRSGDSNKVCKMSLRKQLYFVIFLFVKFKNVSIDRFIQFYLFENIRVSDLKI
jgi:hypothetical protein